MVQTPKLVHFYHNILWNTSSDVSFYDFCATYPFNSICNLSNLLCSPCSDILSPIRSSCNNLTCSVWSDLLASIQSVYSDLSRSDLLTHIWSDLNKSNLIPYNMITSLWYTHSSLIWSYLLLSLKSNPIWSITLPCSPISTDILRTFNFA